MWKDANVVVQNQKKKNQVTGRKYNHITVIPSYKDDADQTSFMLWPE